MTENAQQASVQQALAALTALHPKKIDLGLERIERVLKALGRPERRLPPSVHIAGTNGKGSTVAFLRAMAEAQGLKVHVYTSPHLVRFNERITLASRPISDEVLADVLERVRAANAGAALSFFEATTAAAFLAFSENAADLAIIEVGLGGRFDATNVIERPALTAITPIHYDHAEFLGRDLAGIAREKTGIIKFSVPVISGPQSEIVDAIIDADANKQSAPHLQWGRDYRAYKQHDRLVYEDETAMLDLPAPALPGAHQYANAGLATALARKLQFSQQAIALGLTQVIWPARMQHLTRGALAEPVIKAGGELWLDGGHNPHAGRAVASAMADLEARNPRPLVMITGMLANKDAGGYLDAFGGLAADLIAVPIPGHTALAPETLMELARARGIAGFSTADVPAALDMALARYKGEDTPPRILISGSLYLSGEVLRLNAG